MYLSKVNLPLNRPAVRGALGNCQKMHQLVTGLFGTSRAAGEILYRFRVINNQVCLYIYSALPVDKNRVFPWMELVGARDVDGWLSNMQDGQMLCFDLLAMPSKKVPCGKKHSQRRVLRSDEERLAWLKRKGEQYGFVLITDVLQVSCPSFYGVHPREDGGKFYMDAYQFQGRLQIVDVDKFRQAVSGGIGAGKSYGLGMLLLK